jgi:hypothetical protein
MSMEWTHLDEAGRLIDDFIWFAQHNPCISAETG